MKSKEGRMKRICLFVCLCVCGRSKVKGQGSRKKTISTTTSENCSRKGISMRESRTRPPFVSKPHWSTGEPMEIKFSEK
jgi:hypothetical protein